MISHYELQKVQFNRTSNLFIDLFVSFDPSNLCFCKKSKQEKEKLLLSSSYFDITLQHADLIVNQSS